MTIDQFNFPPEGIARRHAFLLMTAVSLEVLTNRTAVMKRFAISTAKREKGG
jgi:hypothetical protein